MQKTYFCILLFSLNSTSWNFLKKYLIHFYSFFLIALNYFLMRRNKICSIILLNEYSLYFQCFSTTKKKATKILSCIHLHTRLWFLQDEFSEDAQTGQCWLHLLEVGTHVYQKSRNLITTVLCISLNTTVSQLLLRYLWAIWMCLSVCFCEMPFHNSINALSVNQ